MSDFSEFAKQYASAGQTYQGLQAVFKDAAVKISFADRTKELSYILDILTVPAAGDKYPVERMATEFKFRGIFQNREPAQLIGIKYGEEFLRVEFSADEGIFIQTTGDFIPGYHHQIGDGERCMDYVDVKEKIGLWLKMNAPELLTKLEVAAQVCKQTMDDSASLRVTNAAAAHEIFSRRHQR